MSNTVKHILRVIGVTFVGIVAAIFTDMIWPDRESPIEEKVLGTVTDVDDNVVKE